MSGSLESLVVYKHGLFVLKKRHISSNAAPISTVPLYYTVPIVLRISMLAKGQRPAPGWHNSAVFRHSLDSLEPSLVLPEYYQKEKRKEKEKPKLGGVAGC